MRPINSFQLKRAELADGHRIATWVTNAPEMLTFAGRSSNYPFTVEQFFTSVAGRWETYVLQVGRDAVATGARRLGEAEAGRARMSRTGWFGFDGEEPRVLLLTGA